MFTCCTEEVEDKFKMNILSKCIENTSIDINCVINAIETHPDYSISDSNLILLI